MLTMVCELNIKFNCVTVTTADVQLVKGHIRKRQDMTNFRKK